MAEEEPNLVKPAADLMRNAGGSHAAYLIDTQTQNTGWRDFAVRDDHGNATALGTDTESQSVNDKVGVTTSHQTPPIVESEEKEMLYHSVLHQMQQQQKRRPGRRCKKKTLMKMAKLFVIDKEWDSEKTETSEVKCSNGPLSEHEPSVLNEEMFTSSVTSQKNTIKTESPEVGWSDCDKETFFPGISADTTFSGQTAAPQMILREKRTRSTSQKQAKEDCSASTNLLDVPDLNREVSVQSRLITAPEVQRKSRNISSVTFTEDTTITCEISRNSPAAISSVGVSKTQTSKRRKKSTKQKLLPPTLTDHNAMMPQDVSEGFLVSDVTQKDKNEALCTTAAKIDSKDPPGIKSKERDRPTFRKKTLMSKAKLFVEETEITFDQQPSLSQVSSRGKKRKKEVISRASQKRSTEKQRSKLKSAETMDVIPESIIKTEDSVSHDEVAFQVEPDSVQEVEVKTRHPKTLIRKKRICTSRSKCNKGQQVVQLLSTEDVSLQRQNQTARDKETTNISTSQLQNPRKQTANNKKCKAEPVNVPVSVSFCDQMSDIKTEPTCEPATQPLTKKRDSKKSRPRKRPVQRAKNTITLNAPIKEESDYFDIQGGTFSQEQQLDEETARRNNPEKPRKGQRKRKKVEDKASEQTMNPDLNIKCEVLALNQLDEKHTSPIKTQPCRKRKLSRKYRDNTKNPTRLISICGSEEEHPCADKINNKAGEDVENSGSSITDKALDSACKSLKQTGRRKKVKPEAENTSLENLQRKETKCKKLRQKKVTSLGVNDVIVQGVTAQPDESLKRYLKDMKSSQISKCRRTRAVKKEPVVDEAVVKNGNILDEVINPHDVKITGNQEESLNAPKEEQLKSDRTEAANPENMKKFKGKKKRLVGRRCPKVAALVVENVKVAGEVQSDENGLTSLSLPENVKDKRKREGKRAKQRCKGFNIVSNPAITSLNTNVQEKMKVKGKRSKRVKPELCAVKAVEDNKDVKLDKISASFGVQTRESPEIAETGSSEIKSLQGNQRVRRKRKMKSSAAMLSEDTPQVEEVASDLKNGLTVSFEIDCEAPKQTAKKRSLVGLPNQKSSEQQPEKDTGVLMNHEICNKPKMRCKSVRGKTPARSGKAAKAVKMEAAVSSILHTADMDLNAVKQEHDESKMSELTSEVTSSFQDKIKSAESAVSAGNTRMTTIRKRRRNKTVCYAKKKKKQHQIHARCNSPSIHSSKSPFSFHPCNSLADDEMNNLKLKDENVTQRNTVQERTADNKVKRSSELKNYDLLHQKLKPQKPLKCSFCGRSFRHISAFTVHKRIHTGEKPYRCTTCGKRFAHISRLNLHSNIHPESPAACCPCCDRKFKSKDELIVHFCVHLKDIKSSNVTEDVHNQQAVTSGHSKPFRCSVCCKEFISRATFKMHRRTHGGKPHACSVCGKTFCKPSSLNVHEKTHWPVKPYSCSVCCTGFVKLQELKRHSEMHTGVSPFSCARCEKAFGSFALLRSHQVSEVCSEKQDSTDGNQVDMEGFLVSQGVEGQIVTPVCFKCPICKQRHRHWCQHILHLQTHNQSKSYTCETCGQEYERASDMRSHCGVCCRASGEEKACKSSPSEIWKEPEAPHEDQKGLQSFSPETEITDVQSPPPSLSSSSPSLNGDFDISVPSPNPGGEFSGAGNDQTALQPSRFRPQSLIQRHCGRYSCGHCGKSFNRWNKLWLHQRSHRQTVRPFCCSQCDLEFRFLGSYIDHLREHAAQMPYACPLCPDTFSGEENLSNHIFECHKQHDSMKCSTCGKSFSNLRHLKKHKLLHKGARSHFCLPCNVSFSCISALKTHLETHRTRLSVPQAAGCVEPFLFPYHCRKCTAKFSSTDLLQAHQVCHFTVREKPDSQSIASFIPSRAPEETHQGVVSESPQRKRRLPVSNKKHLFRYPHPDRLYVVPVVSSEPPVVISDTEEEQQEIQVQSPSITTPASDTKSSAFPQEQPNISNTPQSSAVPTLRDTDEHETGSSHQQLQDHSQKSPVLQESHQHQDAWKDMSDISDSDSESPEPLFAIFKEKEFVDDAHNCAICMETFTDISKLHEHYIDHAKGM